MDPILILTAIVVLCGIVALGATYRDVRADRIRRERRLAWYVGRAR